MTSREFAEAAIEDASAASESPYRDELALGQPYRSLTRANPWMNILRGRAGL